MKYIIAALIALLVIVGSASASQAQLFIMLNAALGNKPYKQTEADKKTEKFFMEQERWGK